MGIDFWILNSIPNLVNRDRFVVVFRIVISPKGFLSPMSLFKPAEEVAATLDLRN